MSAPYDIGEGRRSPATVEPRSAAVVARRRCGAVVSHTCDQFVAGEQIRRRGGRREVLPHALVVVVVAEGRSQEHHAHGALHRAVAGAVQEFLGGLKQ
jgi:hypothetical protein